MNSDKSIMIDLSHIIGVVKLDNPTSCSDRVCEYGIYTTIGRESIFLITQKEHLSLIEALQETYDYCEMEAGEDADNESDQFNNRIKFVL
jgi:hypothetical protein